MEKKLKILLLKIIYKLRDLEIQAKSLQEQVDLQSEQIRLLNKRDDLALKIINLDKEALKEL